MKPEEVIKYLEMVRPAENYSHTYSVSVGNIRHFGPGSQLNKDVSKAIDLAIQALEKQIAKKPDITHYNGYCGNCNKAWGKERVITESHSRFEYFQYCPTCGQRIDWEETP